VKRFLADNINNFADVVYMGWVRRAYVLKDGTEKRGLRFIAATADSRLEARKVMKKSDLWGVEIWDLT
jgi:hypothetical protein